MQLTLITHVYNAQAQVAHQLARWKALHPALQAQLKFLVIDDHSDAPLQVEPGPLDLRLVRVDDDIDWNMPGCRNLAAMLAGTEWMLFFDIDNMVDETGLRKMVAALPGLDRTRLHVFRRVRDGVDLEPHINSFLISRTGFYRAGAYDEDFSGHYGFEDVLFRIMWRKHVGTEVLLTDIAFEQLDHGTRGLDRDTARNQALIQQRAAAGLPKPRAFVRFAWHEVLAAPAGADPAPSATARPEAATAA